MKYYISLTLFLICLLSSCSGGEREKKPASRTIYAMDTVMKLDIYNSEPEKAAAALDSAAGEIRRLDSLLDRNNEESEIYRINHSGQCGVSGESAELLKTALSFCESSRGAFDITIAPVMDLWGFYGRNYRVPDSSALSRALERVDYRLIGINGFEVFSNGAEIDLGGIAKGFASDRVSSLLRESGINSALLSLGGNVQTVGARPDGVKWKIALQDPNDPNGSAGILNVSDKAVITSGTYQRNFSENNVIYHHLIDPETGYPADNGLASVSVVSESGTAADALSTALFIMGFDRGADYWREKKDFGAVWITSSGKITVTENLAASFESGRGFETVK